MDILCAIHHYPLRYIGGAELHFRRLAQALSARGHSLRVLCVEHVGVGPPAVTAVERDGAVRVGRLALGEHTAFSPYRHTAENPHIDAELARWFAAEPPDVFWLFGGYLMGAGGLRLAHVAGVPTLVSITDYWFVCPRVTLLRSNGRVCPWPVDASACARCLGEERRRYRWPGRALPALMQRFWNRRRAAADAITARRRTLQALLARADAITCPSQFAHALLLREGIDPARTWVIRQGCDLIRLPVAPREPTAPLRVGYIGQLIPQKGVHVLLEAVRACDLPLRVEIHGPRGRSRYARALQRAAAGDPRIRFLGGYEHRRLPEILAALDVVVVPSIWYDNNPNVVLEALACGVPVIASDAGGTAELVRDAYNGFVVAADDAAALAGCLRRLAAGPALLERLRTAIEPVKRVDAEAAEFADLLRTLVRGGARARERA
jgi:glycosyltransferase involved in cell wall biosynthesis